MMQFCSIGPKLYRKWGYNHGRAWLSDRVIRKNPKKLAKSLEKLTISADTFKFQNYNVSF